MKTIAHIRNIKSSLFFCLMGILMFAGCATNASKPNGRGTSSNFEVSTEKAFAKKSDVLIGAFKVSYITEQKGTSSNRGSFLGGGGGLARASANVILEGISQETMQRITDTAYDDFVMKLQAQGYTVHPFALLEKNTAFQVINTKPSPFKTSEPLPTMSADAFIFAPHGQELRLMAAQGDGPQGFGWSSPEAGFSKASVETGIPVIDVHFVIHFATFDGHESRSSASISVGQGISVVNGSQVFITSGYGGTFSSAQGRIRLKESIGSSRSFATIQKKEQSSADTVGNLLAAGVSALLGGGTRSLETFVYQANPKEYESAVIDVIGKAGDGIVAKMVSLR